MKIALTLVFLFCETVIIGVGARVFIDLATRPEIRTTWYMLVSGSIIILMCVVAVLYMLIDYLSLIQEM